MGALVMVGDVPRHVDWCVRRRGAVLLWISVCIYLLFQIDFMSMNCNFFQERRETRERLPRAYWRLQRLQYRHMESGSRTWRIRVSKTLFPINYHDLTIIEVMASSKWQRHRTTTSSSAMDNCTSCPHSRRTKSARTRFLMDTHTDWADAHRAIQVHVPRGVTWGRML